MKHAVTHQLSPELAKKATELAWETYQARFAQYEPKCTWANESQASVSFRVKGVSLQGAFELVPGAIELDLQVPLVFRPFKKKAINLIEREIRVWVDKAERGELDDPEQPELSEQPEQPEQSTD